MNIDWDNVANDAENSPRGVLAEFLPEADELETVIVIVNKWDAESGDSWRFVTSGSAVKAFALVAAAYRSLQRAVDGNPDA